MFVSRTLFDAVQRRVAAAFPGRTVPWSRNVAGLVVADLAAEALRERSDLTRFVADLDLGQPAAMALVLDYVVRVASWLDALDPRESGAASRSPILRDLAVAIDASDELGATLGTIVGAGRYTPEGHAWIGQCLCMAQELVRGLQDIQRRGAAELDRPTLAIVPSEGAAT